MNDVALRTAVENYLAYEEPPEKSLKEALRDAGYKYVG